VSDKGAGGARYIASPSRLRAPRAVNPRLPSQGRIRTVGQRQKGMGGRDAGIVCTCAIPSCGEGSGEELRPSGSSAVGLADGKARAYKAAQKGLTMSQAYPAEAGRVDPAMSLSTRLKGQGAWFCLTGKAMPRHDLNSRSGT
jgi:hypothetical protein